MAVSTIKRTLEERSTSLDKNAINGVYTNTGQDASILFRRIGSVVTMSGWFKTGTNITGNMGTSIFHIPSGYRPITGNQISFDGTSYGSDPKPFYCDGDNVFARVQLSANTKYAFTQSWIGA